MNYTELCVSQINC